MKKPKRSKSQGSTDDKWQCDMLTIVLRPDEYRRVQEAAKCEGKSLQAFCRDVLLAVTNDIWKEG